MTTNYAQGHPAPRLDVSRYVDVERGLINRRIFVDQAIYEQELEQVFGRCWLYLGHESQLPEPNHYFTTYMGEDPVLVVRDRHGQLLAFLNSCRHRGMTLCRTAQGSAPTFRCPFHGWTYTSSGDLLTVPRFESAYAGALKRSEWGLVPVAQLDTFAGLIFATWDAAAPPLREYLGDFAFYLDLMLNRSEAGLEVLGGVQQYTVETNWKLPAEGFVGDHYHVPCLHGSAVAIEYRQPMGDSGYTIHTANGHGIGAEMGGTLPSQVAQTGYLEHLSKARARLIAERGEDVGQILPLGAGLVFPNLFVFDSLRYRLLRTLHPRGPHTTDIRMWCLVDRAMPAELKAAVASQAAYVGGAAGIFMVDDEESWAECHARARSPIAARYPLNYQMGLGGEQPAAARFPGSSFPGEAAERFPDEGNQRNFFRQWRDLMNAPAWSSMPRDSCAPAADGAHRG
jgi:nitrite reductase/ring-hydroxylating ferredoxin subunit